MRIDLLEAFGLDTNVIAILKQKYGETLLPIQERAFKEYQILNGGNFLLSAVTSDILQDKALLAILRTRLSDVKDLRELITDPPAIFMDERQQLFFYRGLPIKLQQASFHYLALLAEKPKQIVARDEIYRHLWHGPMNYDGSNKPYDRQISDHKRRCIAQIKKGIVGKIAAAPGELETLIFTRPKVGYMLNVGKEEVLILTPQ